MVEFENICLYTYNYIIMKKVLFIIGVMVALVSCSKEAGVGGKTTVTGKVEAYYVQEGSFDTLEIAPVVDARVYIVYGGGITQDDDTRTSPDGSYKFEFLNPGDYKLYAFSETLLNSSGLEEVSASVTVPSGEEEVTVPTITLVQYVK